MLLCQLDPEILKWDSGTLVDKSQMRSVRTGGIRNEICKIWEIVLNSKNILGFISA